MTLQAIAVLNCRAKRKRFGPPSPTCWALRLLGHLSVCSSSVLSGGCLPHTDGQLGALKMKRRIFGSMPPKACLGKRIHASALPGHAVATCYNKPSTWVIDMVRVWINRDRIARLHRTCCRTVPFYGALAGSWVFSMSPSCRICMQTGCTHSEQCALCKGGPAGSFPCGAVGSQAPFVRGTL